MWILKAKINTTPAVLNIINPICSTAELELTALEVLVMQQFLVLQDLGTAL